MRVTAVRGVLACVCSGPECIECVREVLVVSVRSHIAVKQRWLPTHPSSSPLAGSGTYLAGDAARHLTTYCFNDLVGSTNLEWEILSR